MFSSHHVRLARIAFATLATFVRAAPESTDITAAPTAIRLADVQQCPVSPKPSCSDDTCQGSIFTCETQFLCSNESPSTASDGRLVILVGCRCCPLPIQIWCDDHRCGAPEDTRVCIAEQLQGCACMTGGDRVAAIESAAAEYPGGFDISGEDLIELEPSSDDEPTNSSAQTTTLASMESIIQLTQLPYAWRIYQPGNS